MKKNTTSKASETDWKRLNSMTDDDIDFSDCPEIPPAMFAKGIVREGLKSKPNKTQVTLRIDQDVLDWFRTQGKGYQTKINSLLRAYKDAHDL